MPPQTPMVYGSPQGMEPPWFSFSLAVYDEAGNQARVAYWGAGATYALYGLIPGIYKVMAHAGTSGGSEVDAWYQGVHSSAEATPVDISTEDAIDVDLSLGVLLTGSTPVTSISSTTTTVFAIP